VRIGVFGGSFDPIHHGHLIVAGVVAESLELDRVLVVPAREQPLKLGQHRAAAVHRLAMVELAVAGADRLAALRLEVDREGPSYTVDTLEALAARDPSAEFHLLLGADAARLLPLWRAPDRIRRLARIVVCQREGEAVPGEAADQVVAVPRIDISSTAVRERVRLGRPIRYWVPDGVARYIEAHGLYREA
jgi:nicotinate-nucleotide adenylyltransferase